VATYEGISQVKETKINMFVHQYELFKMQSNEMIKEMFTRCLPKNKWGPKITAIEEA